MKQSKPTVLWWLMVSLILISGCPKGLSVEKVGDQIHLQTKRVAVAVFMIYDPMADKFADKRVAGQVPDADYEKAVIIDEKIVTIHTELVTALTSYENAKAIGVFSKPDLQQMLTLSVDLWNLYEDGKKIFEAFGITEPKTRLTAVHFPAEEIEPVCTLAERIEEKEAA